jgi:hypothetical protein
MKKPKLIHMKIKKSKKEPWQRYSYKKKSNTHLYKIFILLLILAALTIINIIILKCKVNFSSNMEKLMEKAVISEDNNIYPKNFPNDLITEFLLEKNRPNFEEINKKRTFEIRVPLNKDIITFLSFLTKDTIYFETGSGCSSLIAKYYAKQSYAVEGCRVFFEKDIKNGLKDNIIFHDLKPDNPTWSYPGKQSTLDDWKKYFQAYDKKYNADVILLDGRFKTANALDIFNKIRDDNIVFIHEYIYRPPYFIVEKYYKYVYHWGSLTAFVKRKNIKSIPLSVQEKYWSIFL